MSPVAELRLETRPLTRRLGRLRRRLWVGVTLRGLSLIGALLLGSALGAGLIDWLHPLPSFVRALLLVTGLAIAGFGFIRWLFLPLAAKSDDLALAFEVEKRFPSFQDGLASAIQFLSDRSGPNISASLKRAAVRQVLEQSHEANWGQVVRIEGIPALLIFVALGSMTGALFSKHPNPARLALERLLNPFGAPDWPKKTQIHLDAYRQRIGRNEAFQLKGTVSGVIPDRVLVAFRFADATEVSASADVTLAEKSEATFVVRLEPGRVQKSFRFQIKANDAQTPWHEVDVAPPPALIAIDGVATPQIRLKFPAYTDLPEATLPPGVGNFDAVDGTVISLRAAADRPLSKAWIEFIPQTTPADLPHFLAALAGCRPLESASVAARPFGLWGPVNAILEGDRHRFRISFVPRLSGLYALSIEDDSNLVSTRVFEAQIHPDPAPVVALERPNDRQDSLTLLVDAEFPLAAHITDTQYAVRRAWLEYRLGDREPFTAWPLYDHQVVARVAQGLASLNPRLSALPGPSPRIRVQAVEIQEKMALSQFRHNDGKNTPLKEGDILTLQVAADDFDDVTMEKQPGRSHAIQIYIVGKNAFELQLDQDQAKIEQELVRLREQERQATRLAAEAAKTLRRDDKSSREAAAALVEAETVQKQLRESVGADSREGLQEKIERLRQSLRNNHWPRSDVDKRLAELAEQLSRLAREELPPIEPQLRQARQRALNEDKTPQSHGESPLESARKHQEEVERTLSDLLGRMENWSSTREIKNEAQSLLEEQNRVQAQTDKLAESLLGQSLPRGKTDTPLLKPEQVDQLKETEAAQQALADRTGKLLEKMDRVAQSRKDKDPALTDHLQQTQEKAIQNGLTSAMQEAGREISRNHLNKAQEKQAESAEKLNQLIKDLDSQRQVALDQLVKKLQQAESKLDQLTDAQEQLNKRRQEAAALSDPQKKEEELKRLAREQERLQKEAQELLKQLSRLRAGRTGSLLSKAAENMNEAGQRLERGQESDRLQEEALDRLNEAQEELARARSDAEDELAREQVAKAADAIKQLKERQESMVEEGQRLKKAVESRPSGERDELQGSLARLGNNQAALGEETEQLAGERLADSKVFSRALKKIADHMAQAGEALPRWAQSVNESGSHVDKVREGALNQQRQALDRLDQLLQALRTDSGGAMKPGGQSQPPGKDSSKAGQPGDGIPSVVELKLLRALQEEVNKRTTEFNRSHPDRFKLTESERLELQKIRKDQQEIAEMLDEFMDTSETAGDKP